ncbi:MAG: hypothetical protein V8S73_05075 [Lachnospiraceae bacterium]
METAVREMGMNAMNSMMERFGIGEKHWDYIVYDVLGDIVCSGFSTPMRKKYADLTYIVTSAEQRRFMRPITFSVRWQQQAKEKRILGASFLIVIRNPGGSCF